MTKRANPDHFLVNQRKTSHMAWWQSTTQPASSHSTHGISLKLMVPILLRRSHPIWWPTTTTEGYYTATSLPRLSSIWWQPTTTTEHHYTAIRFPCIQPIGSSHRCRDSIWTFTNPCWLTTWWRPQRLPSQMVSRWTLQLCSPSLPSLKRLGTPSSRGDYCPPCHLQMSQNHLHWKIDRCLCLCFLGPGSHLSLPHCRLTCLPGANQGETATGKMVVQKCP